MKKPTPGERVQLVHVMRSAMNERHAWRVVACDCGLCEGGRHVALNEPSHAEGYREPESRPRWRHISYTSLEAVPRDDPPPTPKVQR